MGCFFQNWRSISCSLRGSMLCMVLYLDFHCVSHQQLFEAVGRTRAVAPLASAPASSAALRALVQEARASLRWLQGREAGRSASAGAVGAVGGGSGLGFGLFRAGRGSDSGWAAGAAGGAGAGAVAPTSSAGGAAAAASFVWIVSSIAFLQAFIAPRSSDQPVSRRGICRS